MHAPNSYTGEDMAEIQCHGSPAVLSETLSALFAKGAVQAEPGEFTRRAFLAGKMDLSGAEAVHDLVTAVTTQAAENAAALQHRSWVTVTATVGAKEHPIYDGVGPWLEAASVTPAQPPKEELVYFLR